MRKEQSPEERAIKVLVRCGDCGRPLGKVWVPHSTAKQGAGKVSLSGGMGLFAQRTVEGYEDGSIRYSCSRPACGARFVVDALDVANKAIAAASQHHEGFRLPSSCRER